MSYMNTITISDVQAYSSGKLIQLYKQFLNPTKDTSYHRYIMEAYNVPESSFYNVLAGRRQTTRVCEAFRQEMIKKITEAPGNSVTVELRDDVDSDTDIYAVPPARSPKSPKSPKRKRKRISEELSLDDREFLLYTDVSPRRKKARISQFTPQSPMDIDEEYNIAPRRRVSSSRRSLFGGINSQEEAGFETFEEVLEVTRSAPVQNAEVRKHHKKAPAEPMILDSDASSEECNLSEEKRNEIKQLVNDFKQREMDKILSYKACDHGCAADVLMAADATLQDLQEQFACTPRKNKRKNQPWRAALF